MVDDISNKTKCPYISGYLDLEEIRKKMLEHFENVNNETEEALIEEIVKPFKGNL